AEIAAPFVGPGETFRIELKLYTAEELTRHTRRWKATWVPWAVIAGGAAVGIAGGLMEVAANSSYKDFDNAVAKCVSASSTSSCKSVPSITNLRDSGDSK